MEGAHTKKIGLNTIILFIRKVVMLLLAFYASRLLLHQLGIDDFGLYGIVGSLVALFSAFRGVFSTSVQRFINVAKGDEGSAGVSEIFSIGIRLHFWISAAFILIVEVGGIILLPTLNVPPHSYSAAFWVLQFTILTAVTTIMTVPFDALIIANERFGAYSVLSVVESVLKLLIVFLLSLSDGRRVIIYSALLFVISLVMRVVFSIYCRRRFGSEARYRKVRNPRLLKEMTSFAGWQFCGNMGYALTNSGTDLVMNLFGGVIVNAARSIANQVMGGISQIVNEINVGFQPRSMILYSCGDSPAFWKLFYMNTKMAFALSLIIAFPIISTAPVLLNIWLGEVPPYSVDFVRWIMIYLVIRSFHGPIDILFKATGHIKHYQLTELCIMLFNLPFSWVALSLGAPYWSVFAIMAELELINLGAIICIASRQYGLDANRYLSRIAVRVGLICLILLPVYRFVTAVPDHGYDTSSALLRYALSVAVTIVVLFLLLFSPAEWKIMGSMLGVRCSNSHAGGFWK